MEKEELIEFLKKNLSISITEERGMYSESDTINVSIELCGEVITEDFFRKD